MSFTINDLASACIAAEVSDEVYQAIVTELRKEQNKEVPDRPGYQDLWLWFGLSYAGWLTLPRVLMHAMPDDWQQKMADLLFQWDETWDTPDMPMPMVSARKGNRFVKWPSWLLNYKHPNETEINKVREK
jgi:hypothetical protein